MYPSCIFSVVWWNSLHQGSSVSLFGKTTIYYTMLIPLMISMLGFTCYCAAIVLVRLRAEVLRRERRAQLAAGDGERMSHYLDMGKYGVYLWPAYGVTLLAVILNIVWARRLLVRSQADALRRLVGRGDTE